MNSHPPTSPAPSTPQVSTRWKPSVTVAAVIEHEGRYLMVEERTPEGLRLNQPAGHLEPAESLLQAVAREVLEETGCPFTPEAVVGVYLARIERAATGEDVTYLRVCFSGHVGPRDPSRTLDDGIVRTLWLSREALAQEASRHRSPLVLRCIDDHAAGARHSLALIQSDASLWQPRRLD